MTTTLSPYINLRGTAREAMDFYHSVFGGELSRSTFGEFGMSDGPATENLVMHSQIVTPGGLVLSVSDTPDSMELSEGSNIQVALSGSADDAEELRGWFDRLSSSGSVTLPLEQAPWGDHFGMCRDAWGVNWMVDIAGTAS
jgi:PhnB protein